MHYVIFFNGIYLMGPIANIPFQTTSSNRGLAASSRLFGYNFLKLLLLV